MGHDSRFKIQEGLFTSVNVYIHVSIRRVDCHSDKMYLQY